MADFNVKEIQRLKLKIQIAEKTFLIGAIVTGFAIYYGWNTTFGLLIGGLIILQVVKSSWKKKLRQKEYLAKVVEERTIELRVQRDQVLQESEKLSKALDDLADTQDELVRSERLATVGQLTKGLVDRILNPLNYINNFAGLSVELITDLKKNLRSEEAIMSKEIYEDSVEIIEMIAGNLQKIIEHGANTVRIVKAMEELLKDHRGNYTSADINHLCKINLDIIAKTYAKEIEEKHIQLKFEGLALPIMIDVNIEQMGKVLQNIYQNAIYALMKKMEKEDYSPVLHVRLRREGQSIIFYIYDNGIGIEENIKTRIFEPFFTTKPTSEASGTGLYLSREVVLNHRGTLTVSGEKNKFTEFVISVPIHQYMETKKMEEDETDPKERIEYLEKQLGKQDKLASLGMLSAGIAHEIQNPLNFVINFSKLSSKLLKDLEELLSEVDLLLSDEVKEEFREIMDDLAGNMLKIEENGNRASSIVRGILLYSRGKDDFMETDLQHLVHEYVWLSYHAVRANNKSFNVTILENYGEDVPLLKVIPQDLSRAVINLVNNACYAVFSRSKMASETPYTPVIKINLWKEGDSVKLSVEDNGIGMPDDVVRKLYTPFFTTKPVGEGTGLGLSLTQSIIEGKHKGKIEVETREHDYTRFVISLPII